jgi:hypothetical protein
VRVEANARATLADTQRAGNNFPETPPFPSSRRTPYAVHQLRHTGGARYEDSTATPNQEVIDGLFLSAITTPTNTVNFQTIDDQREDEADEAGTSGIESLREKPRLETHSLSDRWLRKARA